LCTIIVYIGYILSLYNYKMYIYVLIIPILETRPGYTWDDHIKKTEHWSACQVEKGQRALQETDEAYQCLSSTEP